MLHLESGRLYSVYYQPTTVQCARASSGQGYSLDAPPHTTTHSGDSPRAAGAGPTLTRRTGWRRRATDDDDQQRHCPRCGWQRADDRQEHRAVAGRRDVTNNDRRRCRQRQLRLGRGRRHPDAVAPAQGTDTWTVTGNAVQGDNNFGIEFEAGGSRAAQSQRERDDQEQHRRDAGDTAGTLTLPKNGIHFNVGTVPGRHLQRCAPTSDQQRLQRRRRTPCRRAGRRRAIRMRQRQSTTIRSRIDVGARNPRRAPWGVFLVTSTTGGGVPTASPRQLAARRWVHRSWYQLP